MNAKSKRKPESQQDIFAEMMHGDENDFAKRQQKLDEISTHLRLDRREKEREFRESIANNSDTHRLAVNRRNSKRPKVDFTIKTHAFKECPSLGISQAPNSKAQKPFERTIAKLSKQVARRFDMNFEDPANDKLFKANS
jgi:hypothetical protein